MAAHASRIPRWLPPLFVVACTLIAFLNSLDGEFLMDDFCEILDNPRMESLWPPWRVMLEGNDLPSRPLPYLSFAIDHALWGERAFGYHLTNLAIHVVAALAVFSLARTTLASPPLAAVHGEHADALAALIATLWAVHPLNTQAVTYIYQRMESMTAMLCLISLAAFAGAVARGWNIRWLTACVIASAAAMFSKETACVLPLLVASYDWLFCGQRPAPPGGRPRFYAALCATWLLILLQLIVQSSRYSATGAFDVSARDYFLTQPRVILHYLRQAFWPTWLCFDLDLPLLTTWPRILPSLTYLVVLGLVVAFGLVRRRPWAWPGVAFFLALAPSSSFLPLAAIAEEYRMYLALAAVAAAVVLGCHALLCRWTRPGRGRTVAFRAAAAVGLIVIVILISLTQERNRVYATPGGVWLDVIDKGRGGTRASWNLALACDMHGDTAAAIGHADAVFARNRELDVYEHLADRRLGEGDAAAAEAYLRHAVVVRKEQRAAGDPLALRTVALFAIVLDAAGKAAEAEPLAAAEIERVRGALGDASPEAVGLMAVRARGLVDQGDQAAAESLARTAWAAIMAAPRSDAVERSFAVARLARVLRQLGLDDEARRIDLPTAP